MGGHREKGLSRQTLALVHLPEDHCFLALSLRDTESFVDYFDAV
jgi:hypothetical protein